MFSKLNKLFLAATLLFTASHSFAVELSKKKPTLSINGIIGNGNIIPVGKKMLDLSNKGVKEIQLVINSPGGSVTTGMIFLSFMDAARANGTKVTCFVPGIAASMAFQILLHCDERHTLNGAFLLWHRARVHLGGGLMAQPVPMTAPMARQLANELQDLDNAIFSEVSKYLGNEVSNSELVRHFEAETLHMGLVLHQMAPNFITTHSYVKGLMEFASAAAAEADNSIEFRTNELIYITDRVPLSNLE